MPLGSDPLGLSPLGGDEAEAPALPVIGPAWRTEDDSEDILLADYSDYIEYIEPLFVGVTWWDGADRQPVTKRGYWTGSAELAVTLSGHRTAIGIDPIQQ
jgi:hypothetical protein